MEGFERALYVGKRGSNADRADLRGSASKTPCLNACRHVVAWPRVRRRERACALTVAAHGSIREDFGDPRQSAFPPANATADESFH